MTAQVALIVAMAENQVIGAAGDMPWRLPSDMKRFRRITMGKPIIMGRKTFQSIGKPLDGRVNIIITRDEGFAPGGVVIAHSAEEAMAIARAEAERLGVTEIIIGGGGELYRQLLPLADRLYVTHVAASPQGDTTFPAIDPALFGIESEEPVSRTERDSADARFVVYRRK